LLAAVEPYIAPIQHNAQITAQLDCLLCFANNAQLYNYRRPVLVTESVIDMLADKGYDPKMGARPLGRKIDELIRVPLSKKILFDRLENCTINAVMINDAVDFVIDLPAPQPVVDEQGFIILE
jgi:hypothetical protein